MTRLLSARLVLLGWRRTTGTAAETRSTVWCGRTTASRYWDRRGPRAAPPRLRDGVAAPAAPRPSGKSPSKSRAAEGDSRGRHLDGAGGGASASVGSLCVVAAS